MPPTFSVLDVTNERLLWVSGYGTPERTTFVNEYSYEGEVRRFFGLLRAKGQISAPTRELSLPEARRAIELFVCGNHEVLLRHLAGGGGAAAA